MLPLSLRPRTLEAGLRDLGHSKLEVRRSALRDLGRIAMTEPGEPRKQALDAVAETLAQDGAAALRADAAMVLADASAGEAVEALLAALEDPEERVQQMALLALGEVSSADDRRAREALEKAIHSDSAALRFQALVGLNTVMAAGVEGHAERLLEDEDGEVRYIALRVIEERLDGAEPPAALLAKLPPLLSDDEPKVRLAAAILLARAGERAGSAALVRALTAPRGAYPPEDVESAIELSGRLRLEEARAGLSRIAWDWLGKARGPFAWQARVALARLGDPRARGVILRELEGWTRDGRNLAVVAAGLAGMREALPRLRRMAADPEAADEETVHEALMRLSAEDR